MSPQELFDKAERLEREGDQNAALLVWRMLADVHPDPVSLCRLAWAAEELGEVDEAERAFRRAILADPDFGTAYIGLASIAIDRHDYREAENLLGQALRINEDEDAYSKLGVALKHLGRLEEAKESYLRALTINPSFDEAYYNLGVLLRQTDPTEAESLFFKAVECSPDYAEAHRELGWQRVKRGSLTDAERDLRRAIALRPNDAWAHIYLANLFWRRGDIDGAIAEYGWARESEPERAFPLWNLANLYADQKEWEKAQALYEQALTLEPDDAVGNMTFGRMLKRKGDLAAAKEYLERALFLDPGYSAADTLLAELEERPKAP